MAYHDEDEPKKLQLVRREKSWVRSYIILRFIVSQSEKSGRRRGTPSICRQLSDLSEELYCDKQNKSFYKLIVTFRFTLSLPFKLSIIWQIIAHRGSTYRHR